MGRPIGRLKAVDVPRLAKRAGMHCDGGGLYLRVVLPNECSWVYRYMLNRKPRTMGLGPYPAISLARAREKAAAARTMKADGRDPVAERRAGPAAAALEAAKAMTFDQCAADYIKAHRAGWNNDKHAKQWESTLATYASPVFGRLPVAAVDVGLVLKVLEPIWNEKNETASRLRGRIESILDWAKVRGYRDGENPAQWKGRLKHALPERSKVHKVKHHAALPLAELPDFIAELREQAGIAARALEFTILTAAKTSETLEARWDEIEGDVWTVPAERMKGEREHRVPLPPRALAILDDMKGKGELVFPGAKAGKPLSNMALLMTLRRMGRGDLTTHGFRSTFCDWCGDHTQFPREVAEAALAHVIGDKAEAAYRRSDALEKRRKLMDEWAAFCEPESEPADAGCGDQTQVAAHG